MLAEAYSQVRPAQIQRQECPTPTAHQLFHITRHGLAQLPFLTPIWYTHHEARYHRHVSPILAESTFQFFAEPLDEGMQSVVGEDEEGFK